MKVLGPLTISLAVSTVPLVRAADMYLGAKWEADAVVVITRDHRQIVVAKDKDQVGIDQVAVPSDHSAVGWLAMYPNCCTSYPIPLKLMLYSDGQLRALSPNELPIWYWSFHNGAREVCYEQETVHGGSGVQYELREVATGRLLARFEPGQGGSRPRWVEELEASRGAAARPDRLCVGMRNGFPGRLRVRLFGKADPARGQR